MGYMECGPSEDDGPLNYERLRQISDAMMVVNETLKVMMMDGSSSSSFISACRWIWSSWLWSCRRDDLVTL